MFTYSVHARAPPFSGLTGVLIAMRLPPKWASSHTARLTGDISSPMLPHHLARRGASFRGDNYEVCHSHLLFTLILDKFN